MLSWLSVAISCLALVVSGATAWLTFFRKGKLIMTQPAVIFLGPDGLRFDGRENKIYFRTLLYCTAKRGLVIENIFVSLHRNETKQNFNIWVYGEDGKLKRGSGLFVPQEGVTFNHHFLLPKDGSNFSFLDGSYKLIVFAKLVGSSKIIQLSLINLTITQSQAVELTEPNTGLYYDWGPDQQSYYAHIEKKPERDYNTEELLELISGRRATK